MGKLIFLDQGYLTPIGLVAGVVILIVISYLLARFKEHLPHGKDTLYP
jgi:hypothetical protein